MGKSEESEVKKKKKKKNKVKEEAEEDIVNAPESEPKIEVVPNVSSEEPPKKKKKKSKDKTADKVETAAPVEENEQLVALSQEDQESHTPVNKEDDSGKSKNKEDYSGKSKNKGKGSVVNSSKHRLKEDLNYISDFLSFLHIPQHRLARDEDEDDEEEGEMPEEARERLLLVKKPGE